MQLDDKYWFDFFTAKRFEILRDKFTVVAYDSNQQELCRMTAPKNNEESHFKLQAGDHEWNYHTHEYIPFFKALADVAMFFNNIMGHASLHRNYEDGRRTRIYVPCDEEHQKHSNLMAEMFFNGEMVEDDQVEPIPPEADKYFMATLKAEWYITWNEGEEVVIQACVENGEFISAVGGVAGKKEGESIWLNENGIGIWRPNSYPLAVLPHYVIMELIIKAVDQRRAIIKDNKTFVYYGRGMNKQA